MMAPITKIDRDILDVQTHPIINVRIDGRGSQNNTTIDGTPIGKTTPEEGHFTNITVSQPNNIIFERGELSDQNLPEYLNDIVPDNFIVEPQSQNFMRNVVYKNNGNTPRFYCFRFHAVTGFDIWLTQRDISEVSNSISDDYNKRQGDIQLSRFGGNHVWRGTDWDGGHHNYSFAVPPGWGFYILGVISSINMIRVY